MLRVTGTSSLTVTTPQGRVTYVRGERIATAHEAHLSTRQRRLCEGLGAPEMTAAARELAEAYDVDPQRIVGTGQGGRIVKADVAAEVRDQSGADRSRANTDS